MVEKLQIKDIELNELYAIDKDYLESIAPVYGVIFLFKYGNLDKQYAEANKPMFGEYDRDYQQGNIIFAQQTIQNACATIAVLNILLNTPGIDLGLEIGDFKSFITGFDSDMIGDTISNSELIRSVHNSFSSPSMFVDEDNQPQSKNLDDSELYHFIAYLPINGQIYELDGLKQFPIKHGECTTDNFLDKLPELLQQRIAKYGQELRFSCLAITNNKLLQAEKLGDQLDIQQQLNKRDTWKRENELRKHEFNGLIFALLKNISKNSSDKEWDELLNQARKKGQAGLSEMLARKNKS